MTFHSIANTKIILGIKPNAFDIIIIVPRSHRRRRHRRRHRQTVVVRRAMSDGRAVREQFWLRLRFSTASRALFNSCYRYGIAAIANHCKTWEMASVCVCVAAAVATEQKKYDPIE